MVDSPSKPLNSRPSVAQVAKPPRRKLDEEMFYGELKEGKLILSREKIAKALSQYEDCRIEVMMRRVRNSKTKNQLGWFFGVVLKLISDHTGDDIESLYRNVFLPQFAPTIIKKWKGKEVISRKRISQMSSEEMSDFITRVMVEGADLGIVFPEPSKDWLWKNGELYTKLP